MPIALIVIGLVLVVLSVVDVITTTLLATRRGGYLMRRITIPVWTVATRHTGRVGRRGRLQLTGIVLTLLVVVVWLALILIGWWLVFCSAPNSVVRGTTGRQASAVDRLYYVGYCIVTLGNGDLRPQGAVWQMLTLVVSLSGLVLATLAVTFLLQVVAAVVAKRALAAQIYTLGDSAEDIVTGFWDGTSLSGLAPFFTSSVLPELAAVTQQHLAYPVLRFFPSLDPEASLGPAIMLLDETLAAVECIRGDAVGAMRAVLRPARRSLDQFIRTAVPEAAALRRTDDVPPLPLDAIRAAGVPLLSDTEVECIRERTRDHRARLRAIAVTEGWHPGQRPE